MPIFKRPKEEQQKEENVKPKSTILPEEVRKISLSELAPYFEKCDTVDLISTGNSESNAEDPLEIRIIGKDVLRFSLASSVGEPALLCLLYLLSEGARSE